MSMFFSSTSTKAEAIIAKLREMEPVLRQSGAEVLYVFGLSANGDSRPGSDVDLLVGEDHLSLPQLATITELVGEKLNMSVHVTTPKSLDAANQAEIRARATRIF